MAIKAYGFEMEVVKNSVTISPAPLSLNTKLKAVAPIKIIKIIEVILTVSTVAYLISSKLKLL